MSHFRSLLLVLLSILLFAVSACKKEADSSATPTPAPANQAVTFDKSFVTPGDLVVVTTATDLDVNKTNWEISVGGRRIQLAKTEARKAVFVVPLVAAGPLVLDMTAFGVQTPPALTMASYSGIQNPDQVLTTFGNGLTAALTHLDQMAQDSLSPTPAQEVALVRSLQQQLIAAQANLSPSQKLEAAYALQKMTFDKFDFDAIPPRRIMGDPADDLVRLSQQLTVKLIAVALATDVFMVTIALPDPLSKFVAIAATITAVYQMVQAFKLLGRISDRYDIIAALSLVPTGGTTSFIMNDGSISTFLVDGQGRTLTQADAGTSALQAIISAENKFSRLRQSFDNKLNLVRGWLGSATAALTPYVNPIRQAALRRKKIVAANLVRILNVSNSAISVAATALNNTLSLRASSSTVRTQTPFTFDVNYTNSALGVNTTKTITAEFTPVIDSTAFYKAAMVGQWTVQFFSNNPTTTYSMQLRSDGTGYYTVPNNPNQYGNRWTVTRTSAGYFYSEYGFWHPAYDGYSHTRLRLPMTIFKAYPGPTNLTISHIYTK